jgi:alkylation response protein AidB-like acyl-CoA dehydrogenase
MSDVHAPGGDTRDDSSEQDFAALPPNSGGLIVGGHEKGEDGFAYSVAGGAFLTGASAGEAGTDHANFTPEQFSDEARMLAGAVEEFVRGEVLPVNHRLEKHEPGLMSALLRKAGELGILGVAVPERFGGLDLPKSQIALITEKLGIHPSFAISAGVHCGVATLPLLFFGTPEQQQNYLPKLAGGEWIGAFALSEAGSGSDALSAEARALQTADGSYVLKGTKMWITNGGFADLFTLFARIEGEGFSAFLVERKLPGMTSSREEEKLGLRGSSTTRVVLDNVAVPAENLLGDAGKGHRPALFSLNLGRLAIAATALGICKENLRTAVAYAKERRQFKRPIAEFGLVREKLAEMAIRTFVLESMLYRIAGWLDVRFGAIEADSSSAQEQYRAAAEEYSIECAILKVFGTETLDYVVDEALQIHGGYGFSEEFAVAQAYRDARVFRIFEGTNEVNRMTIVDQVLRRAKSGRLEAPTGELLDDFSPRDVQPDADDAIDSIDSNLRSTRSHVLSALGCSRVAFGDQLSQQQELCGRLADMMIALFATESALLRCRALARAPHAMVAAAHIHSHNALIAAINWGSAVRAASHASEPALDFSAETTPPPDTIRLRREVAGAVLERGGYPW